MHICLFNVNSQEVLQQCWNQQEDFHCLWCTLVQVLTHSKTHQHRYLQLPWKILLLGTQRVYQLGLIQHELTYPSFTSHTTHQQVLHPEKLQQF